MSRLAAGLWIDAYRARLMAEGISAYIVKRGDAVAGAILVKLATLDGRATAFQRITSMDGGRHWDVLADGEEAEVDAAVARARGFDPDLWVIEVEDRVGRHMLDAPGLE
ncbi:MAG: DUF1491 family protein [Pseudomonadota bacterium]